ncbi:MAG TPA: TatD family hydrolase [Candidatus Paceibacterota bacterium]|nr:TatD family hydrolase [Candidatus Paceibacterota bacterium]
MRYIDIHSHVNDARFDDDRDAVLERMRAEDIATIAVGTDRAMSEKAVALADVHSDIWATIGLHPTDNTREDLDDAAYAKLAAHPRVVAIGECGLDYHWPAHDGWPGGEEEEKQRQHDVFTRQIAVAERAGKPLMIHGRPTPRTMDAYEDILAILAEHPAVVGDVHFFVGDEAIAKRFLDRGFTLSFTGVLTFTHDYDAVVKFAPLDRIHAETDAPYVAPIPFRGKRNEPVYVLETIRAIARIRGEDLDRVAAALVENAKRLFHLS